MCLLKPRGCELEVEWHGFIVAVAVMLYAAPGCSLNACWTMDSESFERKNGAMILHEWPQNVLFLILACTVNTTSGVTRIGPEHNDPKAEL